MNSKERLEALKRKCNFRRARVCDNCKFFEIDDAGDYSSVFFCGNPMNEDKESSDGEEYTWEVEFDSTCDYHEFREQT